MQCASIAHAPAKAIGGRRVTFLCRSCNSHLGTTLEAHATWLVEKAREHAAGLRVASVRYGPADGPRPYYKAVFTGEGPESHAVRLEALSPVTDYLRQTTQDGRAMAMDFTSVDQEAVKLAFASWAYLLLFARFGYSYVLTQAAETVRADLADGYAERLGPAFFFVEGDIAEPISDPTVVLVSLAPLDLNPKYRLVAVGARLGVVTISLPLASDPSAERLKWIEKNAQPDGQLSASLVPLPFEDLFGESAGRTFLTTACRFDYTEPGGRLVVIGTSPDQVSKSLKAAGPIASRALPHGHKPQLNAGWEAALMQLPATLDSSEWQTVVSADLVARMSQLGSSPDSIDYVRVLGNTSSPDSFVAGLKGFVRWHLQLHVQDYYDLFLKGIDPIKIPLDSARDPIQRVRFHLRRNRMERIAAVALTSKLIDLLYPVSRHAIQVAIRDASLVVGPFYTQTTLAAAIDELVEPWLATLTGSSTA